MQVVFNQMSRCLLWLGLILVGLWLSAQHTFPPNGELFKDDVIPSIYITLPSDSLDEILKYENRNSDYHYHASFVFDNGAVRDSLNDIGFRLRGNTSRKAAKKSFKISFNEYTSGQKYRGVEKLNVNGEHNDPSICRSKLCFDFLDYLNVPASRTNHVKLYLNDVYFGLYLNVEHYDEEFTKSRFESTGNLYKCTYGADLKFRGDLGDSYRQDYYELKRPNAPYAYDDLANFIDVLNNTPTAKFECEIEHIFNVNTYLKSLVMDVLTGNWDGPNYNKNNFYLYSNTNSGLFEYVPYDLDNTLGVDFLNQEWSDRNLYNWSKTNSTRPLFQKIMAQETYRKRFSYLLEKAIVEYFNPTAMGVRINEMKNLIGEAAIADTIRPLDYNYSVADFNNSFGYFSDAHVKYGLIDFVTRRYNSAIEQLDSIESVGPIPTWHSAKLNENKDSVTFEIALQSDKTINYVLLSYNWEYQSAIWSDTLIRVDSSNNVFSKTIAWHPSLSLVSYVFQIKYGLSDLNYPVCNIYSLKKPKNDIPLFINELVADNNGSIWDEDGEYEDWIELFYDGDNTINLKGYYLTDEISNPFKYRIPTSTVVSSSFKLIWADNDEGTNHANFKLSKAGETVALFDSDGVLIDSVSYGVLPTNNSWGRKTDGGTPWIEFSETTPGFTNLGIVGIEKLTVSLDIYPNPNSGLFNLNSTKPINSLQVHGINGQEMDFIFSNQVVDVSNLPAGVYLLTVQIGEEFIRKKLIKTN
jgi:spore coat protein CotH